MEDGTDAFNKFKHTIELLTRNKVNKSNAFENRILDEIEKLFALANARVAEEQWVQFSTLVDSCGKIYAYCVDHIHDEVFKILGQINRSNYLDHLQETKADLPQRRIVHGRSTLEENEAAINFKDFDRCLKSDLYFMAMSKKFDSNNAETLLLNNTNLNSQLDLVLTPDDKLISDALFIDLSEVNLEGIITFSENELLMTEISDIFNKVEANIKPNQTEAQNFQEVWKEVDLGLAIPSYDHDFVSSASEIEEIENIPNLVMLNLRSGVQALTDSIDLSSLATSNRRFFPQEHLISIKNSKRKKRPRQGELKEEENLPYCVLKIDEDTQGLNSLNPDLLSNYEKQKKTRSFFNGYKECRLGELFTRSGKFVGISILENSHRTQDLALAEPLCIDPLIDLVELNHRPSKTQTNINIKLIKETIWDMIYPEEATEFETIIKNLPFKLSESDLESLSVHTCFVTMLHLANEFDLTLEKCGSCNFSISKSA